MFPINICADSKMSKTLHFPTKFTLITTVY